MTEPTLLTIVALAWRESDHLEKCFQSLALLRERTGATTLIVLNDDADPTTREIALRVADRVTELPFVNFPRQRNHGLDTATTEWVFFIDADERCTPALSNEIQRAILAGEHTAYRVPRRNILFGREVRHTGWWPDYQVRLLRRAECRYDESIGVHELPTVKGSTGNLNAPLIHYNYKTWRQFATKQKAYAKLEALSQWDTGRRFRLKSLVGQPLREFKRRLIDYEGYKDGLLGVALSVAMSIYALEVQRQLLRLQRKEAA